MIIVCASCQARYKFDESKLGDRPKAKTKCGKCGATIEIENPLAGAMTLPPAFVPGPAETPRTPAAEEETRSRRNSVPLPTDERLGSSTITGANLHQMGAITLPKDKRYSLAVIQGAGTGQIFQITKTRTTIGRSGADVNIDDPEASRLHASVEVIGETAIVRDLGSTNGTFVDIDRIDQHALSNQMEFRIGSHVLMLIVTEVE
jgi:predicted Zn finger-like uncharacterized protein